MGGLYMMYSGPIAAGSQRWFVRAIRLWSLRANLVKPLKFQRIVDKLQFVYVANPRTEAIGPFDGGPAGISSTKAFEVPYRGSTA